MNGIKSSITLFGFTDKFVRREYTLEDVLRVTKSIGADGLEVVAPQMIRSHPNPDDEWIAYFKDLCQKYELDPVCYSIYVDNGKYKGRFMTEPERMAATIRDMENAKKMGFKFVRSQDALLPATMEKLLPYAEELDLHLCIELHAPYSPSSPLFREYEEVFERNDSEHLGVVMDFSAFVAGAPSTVLNRIPDDACHKDLLRKLMERFEQTEIPEEELIRMLRDEGGDDVDEMIARKKLFTGLAPDGKTGLNYYRTHPDYEGFRRLLRWSKYIHGKFWYVDEDLNCPGVDYPGFVKIMKEEGYNGYVASEYEGHLYDPTIDDEEQIGRHIRMMKKLWDEV